MRRMLAMDERLHELRRQLAQKTTEIESVVANKQGIGSIEKIDPSDYERLQQDVEELLEQWEEAAQEGRGSIDDTPLNRLIAERFRGPLLPADLCSSHSEGFQLGLLAALDQSHYSFFEFIPTIQ